MSAPIPRTWAELQELYPNLYRELAAATLKQSFDAFPEDAELEAAHCRDKARGHDPFVGQRFVAASAQQSQSRRKLPPFAKEAITRLQRTDDVRLFAGKRAWERARPWTSDKGPKAAAAIVLPEFSNPADYDWLFLAGKPVLIQDEGTHPTGIEAIAYELLMAGALVIIATDANGLLKVFGEVAR